jgi:NitT/TauT family transport system substrate-binding protein
MNNFGKYIVLVFLFMLFVFQASASYGQSQQTSTPVTLKVVTFPFLSFAPLYIAQEEGFFEEQGLRVEFMKMSEEAAIPALIRGDIDVGALLLSTNYFNAMNRGANIKIVAEKGHFSSTGCVSGAVIARKALFESGEMQSLIQLKGRVLDVRRSSYQDYLMDKLLNEAGLTADDVELVDVSPPGALGALRKGEIDVTLAAEPWITRLVRAGNAVVWIPYQRIIPELEHAFILYGPNLLERDPEVGKRFMTAYLKGVRQGSQGKTPRNLEIVIKNTKMDRELLQDVCWRKWRKDGRINTKGLLDFQDWAIKKGLLDRKAPVDRFWDPRYVEHANKVIGEPPN